MNYKTRATLLKWAAILTAPHIIAFGKIANHYDRRDEIKRREKMEEHGFRDVEVKGFSDVH